MKITILSQQEVELKRGFGASDFYFRIDLPDLGYNEYDKWSEFPLDIFVADAYYYPDVPPLLRGIRNIQKLLTHWLVQLQNLPIGTVRYLPLLFLFDHYEGFEIGGFSVRTHDGDFLIAHKVGAIVYQGTSPLYPSDYLEGRVTMTEGNFTQNPTEYVLIKSDFERDILLAIEDLEQQYIEYLIH